MDATMICCESKSAEVRSYPEYRATAYFPGLDGLRAIAILLVIFHHVFRGPDDPLFALHQNGRYGVTLFFVISGFLISTLLLREEGREGSVSLRTFFWRRAVRLLPLYYLVLGVQALAVYASPFYPASSVELFSAKLPAYLAYYSNWLPTATEGPFFFAWSLAVEEQFYLGFGLALVFLPRRLLLSMVLGLALLKPLHYLWAGGETTSLMARLLWGYDEGLMWGVLLGFAMHHRAGYEVMRTIMGGPIRFLLFAAAATILLVGKVLQSGSAWDGQFLLLAFTGLVLGSATLRSVPVLACRPLTWLGSVSYGIYLFHYFVLVILERVLPPRQPALLFLVGTAAVAIVGAASYRFFEQPIIRRCRNWVRRPAPAKSSLGPEALPSFAS